MVDFLLGLFGAPLILIVSFLIVPKEKQRWVVDGLCRLRYDLVGTRKWIKIMPKKKPAD